MLVFSNACRRLAPALLIAALLVAVHSSAHADAIHFQRLTSNGTTDVSSQLSATLMTWDTVYAAFEFHNASTLPSSITGIYFDEGGTNPTKYLAGIAGITDHGTSFAMGAGAWLVSGQSQSTPPFYEDFTVQATTWPNGMYADGVSSSADYVDVVFALSPYRTVQNLSDALQSGWLRIGLHVQSPGSCGTVTDSYMNANAVPEPGTLFIVGTAAIGFVGFLRRRAMR